MNYRKRRARAWAGLYVGLVGDSARTDGVLTSEASEGSSDPRSDGGTDDADDRADPSGIEDGD